MHPATQPSLIQPATGMPTVSLPSTGHDDNPAGSSTAQPSASVPPWRRLAREPLLHFLLLGAAVFVADRLISTQRGDPQTIVVSAAVRQESADLFKSAMKRDPSPADLKILVHRWLDNEVLYREGLALGLDRGDSSIRERVIFKALSLTQSGLSLPQIDRAGLRRWFESRHARYDAPSRLDFMEAVVNIERNAESLGPFVEALNGRGKSEVESSLRVFKDRPRGNLVQGYGEDFTSSLERATPGVWQALPSADGLRVVRLVQVIAGVPAEFEAIEETVYRDWKEDTMSEMTTRAVREMGKKFRVRDEEAAQ
ncbi:MAG: peptidyl-prolyl cis-trans isomerase [Pseudorhodobacter sp.]|nr:peptidyl-prolyl cis-trans isomerase [Rhizobacter sp.]